MCYDMKVWFYSYVAFSTYLYLLHTKIFLRKLNAMDKVPPNTVLHQYKENIKVKLLLYFNPLARLLLMLFVFHGSFACHIGE